jgi:hypothetical protein
MGWKIHHPNHDPRHVDLLAIFALLILIVSVFRFYEGSPPPPSTTAFIVPSQTVHW